MSVSARFAGQDAQQVKGWLRPGSQLSLGACQRLVAVMVQQQGAPLTQLPTAAIGSAGKRRAPTAAAHSISAAGAADVQDAPPLLLLVPPWLASHALELVRQALAELLKQGVQAACAPLAARVRDGNSGSALEQPWQAAMAQQAFGLYTTCYRAVWGAQVLEGDASGRQLLVAAVRLRMLLQTSAGQLAGGEDASAEAASLSQHVGNKRRRLGRAGEQHTSLTANRPNAAAAAAGAEAGSIGGAGGGAAAVSQLLQLVMAVPSSDGTQLVEHGAAAQQAAPGLSSGKPPPPKRIVPQLVQPASSAKAEAQATRAAAQGAGSPTEQAGQDGSGGAMVVQERVVISNVPGMTGVRAPPHGMPARARSADDQAIARALPHGCLPALRCPWMQMSIVRPCGPPTSRTRRCSWRCLGCGACRAGRGRGRRQGAVLVSRACAWATACSASTLPPLPKLAGQRVPAVAR